MVTRSPHCTERSITRRRRLTPWLLVAAAGLGAIVACEHERFWRGGTPWSAEEITRFADPVEAEKELATRLAILDATATGCISCHGETESADMHPNNVAKVT
ncbi:MAG: hypothetical protein HKO59_02630, partial [Phycisphaerales bacterium]|nr:hypothetical protein [Phycisphaerales bacterium]